MRYEIDEKNAVQIFADGQEIPFLFQPDYPDGTPFASHDEAVTWAQGFIASL